MPGFRKRSTRLGDRGACRVRASSCRCSKALTGIRGSVFCSRSVFVILQERLPCLSLLNAESRRMCLVPSRFMAFAEAKSVDVSRNTRATPRLALTAQRLRPMHRLPSTMLKTAFETMSPRAHEDSSGCITSLRPGCKMAKTYSPFSTSSTLPLLGTAKIAADQKDSAPIQQYCKRSKTLR